MKKLTALFGFAGALCIAQPVTNQKISTEFTKPGKADHVRVIIQWKQTPSTLTDSKVIRMGGKVHGRLHSIHAGVYTVSGDQAQQLAADPDVAFISPDRTVHAKLDNSAGAVIASAAWGSGFVGTGVGVAVIDSGINADANLQDGTGASRIVYSQDFTNTDPTASDAFGHGQHVAGIIGSNGISSSCSQCTRLFKGIAPGVNLLDLKVLDANGEGTDSAVIAAIEQAIALKDQYNVRVINLSLGRPVYESYTDDPLCQAVEAAWNAG
ncbi:MAG: S8 family serine peptidase, partial [Acidobacteriaceae bacterium]|nr:S8 family serine peptidase [Acidobacteriaceae bacterium]